MSEGVKQPAASRSDPLGGLEQLSRSSVRLLQAGQALSPGWDSPEQWLAPLLRDLLKRRAGSEIRLEISEPEQSEPRVYAFTQDEVFFGRSPEADVSLQVPSVSGTHARIYREAGRYLITDLDSASGTFLNGARLAQPKPLRSGDQIEIFPYSAAVRIQSRWEPEEVEVAALPPEVVTLDGSHPTQLLFALEVLPSGHPALLGVDEAFLEALFDQLLGQTPLERPAAGGAEVESGIAEYLVGRVLVELNRLAGPRQCLQLRSLERVGGPSGAPTGEVVALRTKLVTSSAAGVVSLYLTEPLLEALADTGSSAAAAEAASAVPWRVRLSLGAESLRVGELSQIGAGDVLLLHGRAHLFLNDRTPLCWSGEVVSEQPWSFRVDKHERRSHLMAEEEYAGDTPGWDEEEQGATPSTDGDPLPEHLESLPALLHVVVGQKELTIADLAALKQGSIVELDQSRGDPVRLIVNGRRLGEGELVEVEGKLGVRILTWG